jgi:NAD+ kinase
VGLTGIKVSFDDEREAIKRRRSSLVSTYDRPPLDMSDSVTECFVHSLLLNHQSNGVKKQPSTPEEVAEHQKHVQSRLLSKKQLSDMAFSIRELGKRLSHIKLKLKVHNIFILGKAHDESVVLYTRELVIWLLEANKAHKV